MSDEASEWFTEDVAKWFRAEGVAWPVEFHLHSQEQAGTWTFRGRLPHPCPRKLVSRAMLAKGREASAPMWLAAEGFTTGGRWALTMRVVSGKVQRVGR